MEFEIGIGTASDLQSEGALGGGAPADFGARLSGGACDSHEAAGERGTDELEADSPHTGNDALADDGDQRIRPTEAAGSTKYRTEWGTASLFQGDGIDSES